MRTIELHKSVTASNDRDADLLRGQMRMTCLLYTSDAADEL